MSSLLVLLSGVWAKPPQFQLDNSLFYFPTSNISSYEHRTTGRISYRNANWKISSLFRLQSLAEQHSWELKPWEFNYRKQWSSLGLELGQSIKRWGQLDLLTVLDTVNGKDLRFGPTIDPQDIRLPTPMIRLFGGYSLFRWDLVYLPFSARNLNPIYGGHWGLLQKSHIQNLLEDGQQWSGDMLTESLIHETLFDVQHQFEQTDFANINYTPGTLSPSGGDIATSLQLDTTNVTTTVYGAYLKDRNMAINLNPTLRQYWQQERLPTFAEQAEVRQALLQAIEISQPYYWMIGSDISTLLGFIGIRGEATYRSLQALQLQSLQSTESPWAAASLAFDWSHLPKLAITVEGSWQKYLNVDSTPWLTPAESLQMAMAAQGSLNRMQLGYGLQALYNLSNQDLLLQANTSWRFTEQWKIRGQICVLDGKKMSTVDPFGYNGGTLGYWAKNDSLTLTLHWTPKENP